MATMLSAAERRHLEANIRKFYAFRFLVNMQFWLPIWVTYLIHERGLTIGEVTALDAPFWLVLVDMEVPTGAIADRYGRRASLCLGALAQAVAVLVFGLATNYVVLLLSYLAWGISFTLFSGADAAFLYDTLKALGRERDYSRIFGRSWAAMSAGSITGTLLGAPLAAWTNLWFPIVLSSVFVLAAFAVSLSFREPPQTEEDSAQPGYFAGIKMAALMTWNSPPLRHMIGLSAVIGASCSTVFILTQPFLSRHGVEVGFFGWFLFVGQTVGMAAAVSSHRVTARIGLRTTLVILPLLVMVATAGLGSIDHLGAFAFFPLNSLAYAMITPAISAYINLRVPSAQRATILSFQNLVMSLLLAGTEPLVGAVADHAGMPAGFRVGCLLLAVGAAPFLALWLRADRAAPVVGASLPAAAAGPGGAA
ncbi:hypothetical protein AYO38_10665 [bacterium SCGC AG-212-C10]|nr:hypothetical protein AYO38_10665 [bacterium SCGC AG-212-C10]